MTSSPPSPPPMPGLSAPPSPGGGKRPGAVVAATVLSVISGLLFLTNGIMTLVDVPGAFDGAFSPLTTIFATPNILIGVAALILGLVALGGSDFGRIFTAGIGGAGLFEATISVSNTANLLYQGAPADDSTLYVMQIPGILNGITGIGIMLALSSGAISKWSVARGGQPAAPAGPPPPMGGPVPPPGSGMSATGGHALPPMGHTPPGGSAMPQVPGQPAAPAAPPSGQPSPYASDDPKT